MLVGRCFRLCLRCSRALYNSNRGKGGVLKTLAGDTSLKYANMSELQLCGTVAQKRLYHSELGDLYENESVQRYLQQLMEEYRDLSKKLQHAYLSESDRNVLIKKYNELLPLANVFKSAERALKDYEEVLSLLHSEFIFHCSVNHYKVKI